VSRACNLRSFSFSLLSFSFSMLYINDWCSQVDFQIETVILVLYMSFSSTRNQLAATRT
jgi:hypothetical protein